MTSLSRTRKAKLSVPQESEHSTEREGIFDQFSEESVTELFYYLVHGSSDAKGYFTLCNVQRGKFGLDTELLPPEADDDGVNRRKKDEGGNTEENSKKGYGFRTRTLKIRHIDKEFDTTLCNTSDESCGEVSKDIVSSDDETYDITEDNWAFVRGGKKKTPEKRKKAKESQNEIKNLDKNQTILKIRLKSALARKTKLQKFASNLRKRGVVPVKQKTRITNCQNKVSRKTPKNSTTPTTVKNAVKIFSEDEKKEAKAHTPSEVAAKGVSSGAFERPLLLKSDHSAPPSTGSFPQKSSTRIRCGYNPTAPHLSPQIRLIRRRQLRQTQSRVSKTDPSPFDDGSTSSEEEAAVSLKTRGNRLSRLRETRSSRGRGDRSTTTSTPAEKSTGSEHEDECATVTSSVNGLKVVIRKKSIEQQSKGAPKSEAKTLKSPAEKKYRELDEKINLAKMAFGSKPPKIDKSVSHTSSLNSFVPKTVKVSSSTVSDKTEASTCSNLPIPESKLASEFGPEHSNEVEGDAAAERSMVKETASCEAKSASEEGVVKKKKKSKKKRKKDRGRDVSSAATGDVFDAQHTAMRLAMEFPRHNWLVKHLIKENKIKAEDDKPTNRTEGEEGSPTKKASLTQLLSDNEILKARAAQAVNQSSQQESQLSRSDPEVFDSQATNLVKRDTVHKVEETKPEELRKHSNGSKGSSMVGIVKPFQHLKMSPVHMEASEMSPPSLCIVDEEEAPNLTSENRNGAMATPCDTPNAPNAEGMNNMNGYTPSSNPEDGKISGVSEAVKYAAEQSSTQMSFITQKDIVTASKRQIPTYNSTMTVSVAEIARDKMQQLQNTGMNAHTNKNTTIETVATQATRTDSPTTEASRKESKSGGITAVVEMEPEIEILSCFSHALDLTKKTEKNVEQPIAVDVNQPLDLSVGPKTGNVSPKVLDLSVKKPPQDVKASEKPISQKQTSVLIAKTRATNPQSHFPLMNSQPATAEQTTTVSKSQPFNNACVAPNPKHDVIIIDDDTPDNKPKSLPSATPSPAKISVETRLPQPKTRKSSENGKDLGQSVSSSMKRCASFDLPLVQASQASASPKRARMSLDDSKRTLAQTYHPPQRIMQSAPRQFLMSPQHQSSDIILETRVQRSNERTPEQLETAESRKLVDLLGVNKHPHVENSIKELHLLPKTNFQAPIPSLRMGGPRPSFPIPRPVMSTNSPLIRPVLPSDFSNKVRPSFPTVTPKKQSSPPRFLRDPDVHRRTARHRSLETSNATAHMVAQAYQPGMQQLGPYIKEQQIAVDKKIQELEAIKQQLANAQKLNSNDMAGSPSYTHPQLMTPRVRQAFTPPSQLSSPLLHKTPPLRHSQMAMLPQIPKPTTLPSPAQLATNAHGFLMHQPPTVRSSVPRHGPPAPVNQDLQRRPPQAPPAWRTMPPRSEQLLDRPRPVTQRSALVGGRAPVNQTIIHLSNQPHTMSPQGQIFSRFPVTSAQPHITTRLPPAYRPPQHPSISRMQSIPVPRIPALTTTPPFYRNGGLTVHDSFRTKINESIVIEDEMLRHQGTAVNPRKRAGSQSTPDSLKVRRAHSYHPPLSRNRVDPPIPQPINSQRWSGTRLPSNYKGPQTSSTEASESEICVRCKGKAFFLCSGCRKMWYCSKKCQLQHWTLHSSTCVG